MGVGASAAMRAGAAVPRRPRRRPQRPLNDASHPLPLSHLEQAPLRRQAGHILVVRRPEHAAGARGAGGGEGGDPRVGGAAGGVGGCLKRAQWERACKRSLPRPARPAPPHRPPPGSAGPGTSPAGDAVSRDATRAGPGGRRRCLRPPRPAPPGGRLRWRRWRRVGRARGGGAAHGRRRARRRCVRGACRGDGDRLRRPHCRGRLV